MMKHKWNLLAGLMAAALAIAFGVAATQDTVEASKGPSKQHVTAVNLNIDELQLVTQQTSVRPWDYPDGAHMGQVTFYWEDTGGSTWDADSYSIWNVPYSSGGHTDTLTNSCIYNYVSDNKCTGGAGDGGTRVDFGVQNISDASTFWLRVRFNYGGTEYCRQVYLSHTGLTSVGYCTN
jgi:hypothetical protein